LIRRDGYPIPVGFPLQSPSNGSEITEIVWKIQIGRTHPSSGLLSGKFRIEARMPGGRSAWKDIELVAGERLAVELDFGKAE
jgi:hypothetical protein